MQSDAPGRRPLAVYFSSPRRAEVGVLVAWIAAGVAPVGQPQLFIGVVILYRLVKVDEQHRGEGCERGEEHGRNIEEDGTLAESLGVLEMRKMPLPCASDYHRLCVAKAELRHAPVNRREASGDRLEDVLARILDQVHRDDGSAVEGGRTLPQLLHHHDLSEPKVLGPLVRAHHLRLCHQRGRRGGHSSHKHPLQRSERLRHAAGIVKHDQRRPLRDAKLQTFEGEIATVRVHRADPADVVSVHRVCRRLEEDVVRSVREERLEVVCLPFLPERCCAVVRLAWARHVVVLGCVEKVTRGVHELHRLRRSPLSHRTDGAGHLHELLKRRPLRLGAYQHRVMTS
mmetsp:Transcript_21248/g.62662  ORF Transcript_21248/g.62662 Transcript_21248/m.62662 type:complete len:342 (+) Transcript_21248:272-1297(+)